MYANGAEAFTRNAVRAAYWYRRAAEQGHAEAQSSLGFMYVNGEDVRFLDGLGTPVSSGDEVSIVPAVAGG